MTDEELKRLFDQLHEDNRMLRRENEAMDGLRQSQFMLIRQELGFMKTEMERRFNAVDRRFDAVAKQFEEQLEEVRRHFDVVYEKTRGDSQFFAEGIAVLDEKLTRELADIREEMRGR